MILEVKESFLEQVRLGQRAGWRGEVSHIQLEETTPSRES